MCHQMIDCVYPVLRYQWPTFYRQSWSRRERVRAVEQTKPTGVLRYQAKQDFVVRTIAGETLLIPVGAMTKEFNGMILLNETGAFLWEALKKPRTEDELVGLMLAEFETDASTALSDMKDFLTDGIQNEMISCIE